MMVIRRFQFFKGLSPGARAAAAETTGAVNRHRTVAARPDRCVVTVVVVVANLGLLRGTVPRSGSGGARRGRTARTGRAPH